MPVYTFSCAACGWRGDRRTGYGSDALPCPDCTLPTARTSVYAVSFGGFARTPASERDWSGDFKDYQEASHEIDYRKGRLEDAMQKRIPDPPLYGVAKAKANDLIRKGAKDANDL